MSLNPMRCVLPIAIASVLLVQPVLAQSPASGPTLDLRYRYENVNDDAFARNANAHTLRARFGYRWVASPRWTLFAEGEYVEGLFNANYNSTTNGNTAFPVVADPDATELNQAYVSYADAGLKATLGRQRLIFDNHRFIGNVGWRQNEQTFDALDLTYKAGSGGPSLRYAYLDRAQRIFGDDSPQGEWNLDVHAINVNQVLPVGSITGYAYLIDNQDVATGSLATYGLRWTGNQALSSALKLGWTLEAAKQKDHADNPQQVSADYLFIEPTLGYGEFTAKAGYERLQGNGVVAFQTPLATLHAFNGWADRFLSTPGNGLEDVYVGVGGKHGQWSWQALWHDFSAERGGADYGTELDAQVGYAFTPAINALVKLADYRSDGFSSDETKLWLSLEYRY
jgi:hypothetical protein